MNTTKYNFFKFLKLKKKNLNIERKYCVPEIVE